MIGAHPHGWALLYVKKVRSKRLLLVKGSRAIRCHSPRLLLGKEIPLLGEMSAMRTKGSAASARRAQTDKKTEGLY